MAGSFTPSGVTFVAQNIAKYLSDLGRADKAQQDLGKSASRLSSIATRTGSDFVGLGNNILSVGATAGLVAAGGVAVLGAALATFAIGGISQAKDLDQQMADIAAVMSKTKAEVTPLKEEILALSISPDLRVNATQAADAVEILARNGLDMTQILDGAAKSTIALSNATKADFAVAGDIATDVMSVFNIEAGNMERAIDGITGVVNHSKLDINDYALALSSTGAVAQGMGISFEDMNTVLAATASSFSSGRVAGTSLKVLLQQLANPTTKAQEAMDKYGISLFDSEGNMRDMSEVAQQLHDAFTGLTDAQKAQLATTLGGADGSRQLIALSKLTADEFENLSSEVNASGQAMQAAATRVDSLEGAIEIMTSVIDSVRKQVGDQFLPLLQQMALNFADLASQYGPAVIAFFGDMAASLEDTIGWLVDFGSALITAFQTGGTSGLVEALGLTPQTTELIDKVVNSIVSLGNTITSILTPAFDSLTAGGLLDFINTTIVFMNQHFEELQGALLGVGAVLAAGIFAALVAAVLSLLTPINLIIAAAALLGAAWAGNWYGIRDTLTEVWNNLLPVLTDLWTWLETNIPIAIQTLSDFWTNTLLPALQEGWNFIQNSLIPTLMDVWTWLATNVPAAIQTTSDFWNNTLLPAINAVWSFIQTSLIPLFESVANVLSAVVDVALTASAGLWQNVLQPALEGVWSFIQANVIPVFEAIADVIGAVLEPVLSNLAEYLLPTATSGFEGITNAIQGATDFFNGLADSVRNFQLPDVLNPGSPTPFEEGLRGVAEVLSGPLGISLAGFQTAVELLANETIPTLTETFLLAIQSYIVQLQLLAQQVMILDQLFVVMTTVTIPTLREVAIAAIQEMLDGFNAVISAVQYLISVLSQLIAKFQELAKAVAEAMADVVDAIAEATNEIQDNLIPAVEDATEAFEKMADAAEHAAAAARDAGNASAEGGGPGFQAGTHGIRTTPAGVGTFPITLHPREEFAVAPPGMNLLEMLGARGESRGDVIVSISGVTINNGMDLANFEQRVMRAVTNGLKR